MQQRQSELDKVIKMKTTHYHLLTALRFGTAAVGSRAASRFTGQQQRGGNAGSIPAPA